MDNLMEQDEAIFLMECMEASVDDETILLKELELLTACAIDDGDEELLMQTTNNNQDVKWTPRTLGDLTMQLYQRLTA